MFNCYNFLSDYVFDLLFVDVLMLTQLIAIDIMSKLMVWWFHWYIFPYIFLVHMNHQMHMLVRRSNFLHRHASVECLLLKWCQQGFFFNRKKKIHGTTTLPSFKYFTCFSDFIYSGSHVYLMVFFQVNAVKFNEYGSVVVSAGYDRSVRAFDCRSHSTEPIQVNCFSKITSLNYIIM